MSRKWWVAAAIVLIPVLSEAQSASDTASYRRAQALVNDGNGAAGRAIVDSILARATPGRNDYAEGLYWRAVLSATAAEAEMDYRRIIVDYSLSPRSEDVLLRLAQLELARADYDGALQHLNRLTLEHPNGAGRARAGYWTARVLFEKNDVQRACAVNSDALARTGDQDTELRNQIAYLNQRCAGVMIATAPDNPIGNAVKPDSGVVATDRAPANTGGPGAPKTAAVSEKPSTPAPTTPRDVKPSMVEPPTKESVAKGAVTAAAAAAPAKGTASSAATATKPTASTDDGQFSVQVAAYKVKSQATAMVAKLGKAGYEARVSGTSAPFRVQIGHYATRAQATAVMRSLKAKQMNGFVVKAESR